MSIWGVRTPKSIRNAPQLAAAVHHAGVAWMAPIAVQDVRYRELRYGEAGNTETLRASWERALSDHADFAQLITWNDYSESTQVAPSATIASRSRAGTTSRSAPRRRGSGTAGTSSSG